VLRLALTSLLLLSTWVATAGHADPVVPDGVVGSVGYASGAGGSLLSWSQTVTPTAPVVLGASSTLFAAHRTRVPAGADRDADGSVTTSLMPSADKAYFIGEPVAAKGSVFPFLWAKEGSGQGAPALHPPLTYTAAVSSMRWPFLQGKEPAPDAGRGRLGVAAAGYTRTKVGYTGAAALDRLSTVTTVSGVLVAQGGDVVGGAYSQSDPQFTLTNKATIRLPKGTFDQQYGIWQFSLALATEHGVPFLESAVRPFPDHDELDIYLSLSGRLPRARTDVVDGERVWRQGIPFVIVMVDKAFGIDPVVSSDLPAATGVITRPDGTTSRGLVPGGRRATSLGDPLLPVLGVSCNFGFGAWTHHAPPKAVAAPGRAGAPAFGDWSIAGRPRRTVQRLSATGLDVDGAVTPLTALHAERDVVRHRTAWGDDVVGPDQVVGTSFYGAFTDYCSYDTDHVHRATSAHESPGMKLGLEHRLLYVTDQVVADVRLATVDDSRSTYVQMWPVLRVAVRVWSLDGRPHQVRVRALLEARNAVLQVGDTTSGGGPSGPVLEQETTVPGEELVFLAPRDGSDHYRLLSGNTAAGIRGETDVLNRYAGPQGVTTIVNRSANLLTDPVPGAMTALKPDVDLYLASAPSAGSPAPSSYTGFLAALIADDAGATQGG
jgi:hypothetical protein